MLSLQPRPTGIEMVAYANGSYTVSAHSEAQTLLEEKGSHGKGSMTLSTSLHGGQERIVRGGRCLVPHPRSTPIDDFQQNHGPPACNFPSENRSKQRHDCQKLGK